MVISLRIQKAKNTICCVADGFAAGAVWISRSRKESRSMPCLAYLVRQSLRHGRTPKMRSFPNQTAGPGVSSKRAGKMRKRGLDSFPESRSYHHGWFFKMGPPIFQLFCMGPAWVSCSILCSSMAMESAWVPSDWDFLSSHRNPRRKPDRMTDPLVVIRPRTHTLPSGALGVSWVFITSLKTAGLQMRNL